MKKNEKLLDAIGNIDDYMIDAAYNKEKNKKSLSGVFEAIGAVAAVAAIAVFAVVLSQYAKKDQNIAGTDTVTGDETVTTKVEDKIIEGIKDDNVELINIKDIKEISGDYHWTSEGAEQWYNAAGGMTLHEILSSDIVAYNLPSLMPKGYILSHTGMDGSYNNIENCRSLTMLFIDNTNNAVEEHRDENGEVIYKKDKYNSLSLTLLNKSLNEGSEYIDFITDKYLITGTLSAANIYRDFHTEYPDGHTEYEFLIETDDYYILYAYNGSEGGERDLNCKNLYRIAASTPYIKDNGYKYTDEDSSSDEKSSTENEHNVFICGDQRVTGLEGLICDSYDYNGQHVEVDGYGISQELISMENPPTLYYKQGDTIEFVTPEDKSFNCFQLWDKNGKNTISINGHLYGYLDENPGEYYLTAELRRGGKYTSMGVKLIVSK